MQSVQKQVVDSLLAQISVGIPSAKIIDLTASKITAGTITAEDIRVEGTAETGSDAIVIFSDGTKAGIKSDDFVTRSAGFIIRSDGSAEFNNVLIRGDIESGNWNGASPANLGVNIDPTATAGFYLDSSTGAMQIINRLFVGKASNYIQFNAAAAQAEMRFEIATLANEGSILAQNDSGTGDLSIVPPSAGGSASALALRSTASTDVMIYSGDSFEISNGDLWTVAGSAAGPSHSFALDKDTGMYRFGLNAIGWSTSGVNRMDLSSAGLFINVSGSGGTPSIRLNDLNTGFFLQASDQIGFGLNGAKRFHMAFAGNGSRLYGSESNDFMEIDGVNEWFQFFNLDIEIVRMIGTGSASVLQLRETLTDVGNQEILRLNRGTGDVLREVGYNSSWIIDPDSGFRKKVFVKHLQAEKSPEWKREWFLDLDPIQYERRWPVYRPKISRKATKEERAEHYAGKDHQKHHREINFYIENLIEHTNLLTTKGSEIGNQPDTEAILAVTVDFVQNLHKRLDEALERIAVLEAA